MPETRNCGYQILDFSSDVDRQFGKPYPVSGDAIRILDNLVEGCNHRWFISSGDIYIQPKSGSGSGLINTLIVTEENIKGEVEYNEDVTNKTASESSTRTAGVKLTVNLNGNVNTASGLEISAKDSNSVLAQDTRTVGVTPNEEDYSTRSFQKFEGKYLIESVSHELSYEGGAWDTTVEARG